MKLKELQDMNYEQRTKNKEMQIEEMAKIYCKTEFLCNNGCQTEGCRIYEICDTLYNAGYRKADEVRKETAEKILNELIDSSNKITFFDCRMALGLDKLAKKYGVEIKE